MMMMMMMMMVVMVVIVVMLEAARTSGQTAPEFDVVVIGAGASGISAARTLVDAGLNTVILEARGRYGGRMDTQRRDGYLPVEMGGAWIHTHEGNPLHDLAVEAGIPTQEFLYWQSEMWRDGAKLTPAEFVAVTTKGGQAWASKAPHIEVGKSVYDAMDEGLERRGEDWDADIDFLMSVWQEASYADNLEVIDSGYPDEYASYDGADHVVPSGYITLMEYLLFTRQPPVPFRLNHVVTAITYDENGVTVTCNNNGNVVTVTARRAVVTIPLGVLKRRAVSFSPALPAPFLEAIDGIAMGCADKMALYFNESVLPLLQEHPVNLLFRISQSNNSRFDDAIMHWYNDGHVRGEPILISYHQGAFARRMELLSDEETLEAHMLSIREIIPDIPDPVAFAISRWDNDPFAYGSYTFTGLTTTMEHYHTLQLPVVVAGVNVFYFAGEASGFPRHSYMDGAYSSGILAANNIIADLLRS